MAKYKRYDYKQSVMIPVSLEDQLMPGTLEFAIHRLVEEYMDTSVFDTCYQNDQTGRHAYDPKVLLKIVLLGYSRGLISSRKLEQACRENVVFMAMSCGQQPDHSTIAAFVSTMADQIVPLFRDVLLVCEQLQLLGGTFFALDGCKLPSNASKQMSGKRKDLKRKKRKIEHKVKRLLAEQIKTDKEGSKKPSQRSNREKQIAKLEKQAERIGKWLKQNEPRYGTTGKEVQRNVTDKDSAKMLSSHGMIQGYNGQALVDAKHQVIVHGEAFGKASDSRMLPPMVDGAKKNMAAIGNSDDLKDKVLTADADYHSQYNLEKCHDEQLDAYIPDRHFRSRDAKFKGQKRHRPAGKNKFGLSDFKYIKTKDQYRCPNGRMLKLSVKRMSRDRIIYRRYMADFADCRDCELINRCLRRKNAKRRTLDVPIGAEDNNYSKKMQAKIDSDQGRKIYPQRLAIVEPVFANIRVQKRLDRFTLRSKIKVNIQWMLYCMVHNIEKITRVAWAC